MDRSRRGGTKAATSDVPAASRLTVRSRSKNRKRPGALWTRLPKPGVILDACGRAARRTIPAVIATVAVTGVGSGVWLGYRFVTTSPHFAITSIEVKGAQRVTDAQVLATLPVKLGDNVFASDLDSISRSLAATPWIASASAHRELPHTLVVEIREHQAAAVVELGDLYLVDPSGHPFKRAQVAANEGADLPIITGIPRATYEADPTGTAATITTALGALAAWKLEPNRPSIGELHVDTQRTLTLRTYEHATAIQLGPLASPPELQARMAAFDAVWAELPDAERARATALHLDARTDQVTVALRTESVLR